MKLEEVAFKYSNEKPPVYDRAHEAFGIEWEDGIIFTYAPYIHCRKGVIEKKDRDVLEHEKVHIRQQTAYPGGPAAWWEEYFTNSAFRLSQELEAYRYQYQWVLIHCPNNAHFFMLKFYAECLSTIYAIPDMTKSQAMTLIQRRS